MLELLPPLNEHNLPWMDTIHPIVVHFVIAMGLISFVFDLIGVVTRRSALFEVSFWNLLFATAAIFVASMFRISRQLHQPGLATVMGLLNSRYTLQAEKQEIIMEAEAEAEALALKGELDVCSSKVIEIICLAIGHKQTHFLTLKFSRPKWSTSSVL